jgi:hypothetical protein
MENTKIRRELAPLVTAWSDGHGQTMAISFVDGHRRVLPRGITRTQLMGLRGIVNAIDDIREVTDYAKHQGNRASKARHIDVADYWSALGEKIRELETEAAQLYSQAGYTAENAPNWLEVWVMQEFMQHVFCHSLYLGEVV